MILAEMPSASGPTLLFRDVLQEIRASNRAVCSVATEKSNRYVAGLCQGLEDITAQRNEPIEKARIVCNVQKDLRMNANMPRIAPGIK